MTEKIRVRYRVEKRKSGDVVAHFVDLDHDERGVYAGIYMWNGGHGGADRWWLSSATRKATPAEYAEMHAHLVDMYAPEYELVIKQSARRNFKR